MASRTVILGDMPEYRDFCLVPMALEVVEFRHTAPKPQTIRHQHPGFASPG